MDAQLSKEILKAIKSLEAIAENAKAETKGALQKAAVPVIEAARLLAPVSEEIHYRYSTPKAAKNIRAPKGKGKIVATYRPGNLRDSIKAISFRRSKYAVFVGPVIKRGESKGTFGPESSFTYEGGTVASKRSDGYYGAWIEFGAPNAGIPPAPFMDPAAKSQGQNALRLAVNELKKAIETEAKIQGRKNGVK